ncbi:hypothetical protein UFOVP785_73 [uncultured Caudovirales phage]|uniref:Uncharacterized protein n=1 Tax=uncultured Caudovirales phage TaxID=2100421 RepID=A0A6J5NZT5_9CAUD|nr:hypothetical protein UFOVP785_73 [uncultured Caudovirales phage]
MRPKTLAHDWCADASCETCSHRHKSESQPMRPKPAVGQVWRTADGVNEYAIVVGFNGFLQSCVRVWDDNTCVAGFFLAEQIVADGDTYVGKFAGFKVQEEGGK